MKILNIGSGPVTATGNVPGIDITHSDRRDYPGTEYQDMENLTYSDKSFDLVVCVNALDHTPNAYKAVQELLRIGKWVYIKCWLIQHTTSGKTHYWDMLEDGTMTNGKESFNLSALGFECEFTDNHEERRYNYVVARYHK